MSISFSGPTLRHALVTKSTVATHLMLVTGGVAFLALLAQIALPIPGSPVPVTGQTLGVLLIGSSYGAALGSATFLSYLLIGIAGVPVFAHQGAGLARLTGATGGYLVGMLLATYLVGYLSGRKWDQRLQTSIFTMLAGSVVTFTFGLIWLHSFTDKSWSWTFNAGLTPFILGEVIKIGIAGTSLPVIWRVVQKRLNSK
jgi:biotin transport system substrate-specific component